MLITGTSLNGETYFINMDKLLGFVYLKDRDVTEVYTERKTWDLRGDCTQKIVVGLRMAGQTKVFSLENGR